MGEMNKVFAAPATPGFEEVPELLVRARAVNGGEALAPGGPDREGATVADLPLSAPGTYLADRRPDLY